MPIASHVNNSESVCVDKVGTMSSDRRLTTSLSKDPSQSSFKSLSIARPRRSCLRRQSTATTVGSNAFSDDGSATLPDESAAASRKVAFAETLHVQEYGMILGDNPCVDQGYVVDDLENSDSVV